MFSVQPQRNNDRRETSESAGQNKAQRQTTGVDGARGIGEQLTVIREIRQQPTVQRFENQQCMLKMTHSRTGVKV